MSAQVLPLLASSGNVQIFAVDPKDGIENQYPLPPWDSDTNLMSLFPPPPSKLSSNDIQNHDSKRRRQLVKQPRHKRLVDADRPYLQHPKYLEYRSRSRQDIGADGKPIWSDEVELAFQNALVHIKPMGRRKCSQRGKPYGRNMLIAEWILRETGEVRVRKQVSSHIQVLDRFLSGIPEWDRLIKPGYDNDAGSPDSKFYHNSIENLVNENKAKSRSVKQDQDTGEDCCFLGPLQASRVKSLNFEMWVSLHGDYNHVLHNYTRLQPARLRPVSLEDLVGWRESFPHLQMRLCQWGSQHCELILLNASFQLMQNFPPRQSKLGIGLELNFPPPLSQSMEWNCTTYIYQEGVLIADQTREVCRVSDSGNVKPFFQSQWWASTFTSLIEARKLAEESRDPKAIQLADEHSNKFLRSLSIMQELSATPSSIDTSLGSPPTTAVLLWQFSQPPPQVAGLTTWQNLVVPSSRLATHCALPELPALAMDCLDECSPNPDTFDSNNQFLSRHALPYCEYVEAMDEDFGQEYRALTPEPIPQDGYTHQSFDYAPTQALVLGAGETIDPMLETFNPSHGLCPTIEIHSAAPGNIFELPQFKDQSHPLTSMNLRTHQLLQERLGTDSHQSPTPTLLHSPLVRSQSPSLLSENLIERQHLWTHLEESTAALDLRASQSHEKPWVPHDEQDEALRAALEEVHSFSHSGSFVDLGMDDM